VGDEEGGGQVNRALIAIRLLGPDGEVIEEAPDDVVRWLGTMLPLPEDVSYPVLAALQTTGTTRFTSSDVAPFTAEWRRLRESGWMRPWIKTDGRDWEHARVMSVVGSMAARCERGEGAVLEFVGE
jgi:hypothetical protein